MDTTGTYPGVRTIELYYRNWKCSKKFDIFPWKQADCLTNPNPGHAQMRSYKCISVKKNSKTIAIA